MSDDIIILKSIGSHIESKLSVKQGRIELLFDRIVFYRDNPLSTMFGLIGALLSQASPRKASLTLKLSDIKKFERQRFNLTTKVIQFDLINGESYRLKIGKFDQFLLGLKRQLLTFRELKQVGEQQWIVGAKKSNPIGRIDY